MFTGIIDHSGKIISIETLPHTSRLWVKHCFDDLTLGESIAVDGVCLTVALIEKANVCFDVSSETLQCTTLKFYKVDQLVNLERALLVTSRLSGHFVMGHVDLAAKVKCIEPQDHYKKITFSGLDATSKNFLLKKGSIAVNGVSLTINEVAKDGFSVMLVPHTLKLTNLNHLGEGDSVNIEFDVLARMLAKQLEAINNE